MTPDEDSNHMAAILVFAAALAFAVSPFFVTDFNGFRPDQFPIPQDKPPIQPSGYAFSIWGVIYIWLLIHAGTGLFQRANDPEWAPMRWPLFISLVLGASWLAVAVISPFYAMIQIFLMLAAGLIALFRSPHNDRWRAQAPVAIYCGWLTAASFVSVGLNGAGYGVLMGEVGWGYLALLGALVFAIIVQLRLGRAPEYGAAVIWALTGVAVANFGTSWGMVALCIAGILAMAATMRRVWV